LYEKAFAEKGIKQLFSLGAGDVTGRNPIWPIAVKEGIVAASNMVGVERKFRVLL